MAPAPPSSTIMHSRPTSSCIRCADRKVKCDRENPCGACVKHNVECVFNLSRPPRKKQKGVRNQVLIDRLKTYEALLKEQGIDPGNIPITPDSEPRRVSNHTVTVSPKGDQLQSPASIQSEPSQSLNKTQVVHSSGRTKFVDNSLWTRVVEEFHDSADTLEDSSSESSDPEAFDDDFGFVFGGQHKSSSDFHHPSPERILQLWQIFTENVDPLTKVVHVPTLRPAIQKAASNIRIIPRSFEALMFAIYAVAVVSLNDDECNRRFSQPRKTLLSGYLSATEAALSRAKFMGTTNLVVLQALVLYIVSLRDIYEPRALWTLTGVAVRIAQRMGLERDGTSLKLPPFETEMRRRIWWLLRTHDFRAAELCGLQKFRDLHLGPDATKWPTNVNDHQLYPGMTSIPAESTAMTDNIFIALRYELGNFAAARVARFREQGKPPSEWDLHATGGDQVEIAKAFREIEELIETKYLRYCDPSQPLHLLTMLLARAAMNIIRFLTHHPRRWASFEQTPLSERQWIWEISIKLLEQHNMVKSSPQLKNFAWHASWFLHWHSFIHVLDTLRANPGLADAEKIWQLICSTYENCPDLIFDTKRLIHVAVGNLCLKAYSAHEAELRSRNMGPPPTPEFILQLRQQRETARAKKQARDAKGSLRGNVVGCGQAETGDPDHRLDSHTIDSTEVLPTHLEQVTTQTGEDPFWFISGFDGSQVTNLDDAMNLDPDILLTQDHGSDAGSGSAIVWEQWDAWLADSSLLRPQSSARD